MVIKQISYDMISDRSDNTNIKKHFNIERMYQYLGQDLDTAKEILSMVLIELEVSLRKFEDFIMANNLHGIKATAHKLIGTSSSVGLMELSNIARKFEGEPDFDPVLINIYYTKIKSEVKFVAQLINNFLSKKSFSEVI
ncbi:Hpt domain-containing protein [Pedobacter sp. SD-b]|uniref:Hpt domain-containing protein n=1 Tax=Pedobacter segetis TaxID=2793069 RepID=A0ABS1BGK3_9SPHI|nr:Hpt domain-containing protein [Pedobacter segetis]MBK0381970.1 Hpt domain-containing protein [Pedobacter segetis]